MKLSSSAFRFLKHKAVWIPGLVVLLLLALLCQRGWVRNSAIPALVGATYGRQLEKTVKRELVPVNEKLAPLGFDFKKSSGYSDKTCGLAYFHNFRETVVCSAGYRAELTPTGEQKATLSMRSADIESWLSDAGWTRRKGYYTLSQIFGPEYSGYGGATYEKHLGPTECTLYMSIQYYDETPNPPPLEMSVSTWCSREIRIFGGNDTLHDPALF